MNNIIHEIINYQPNIPIKLFYQRIGSVSKHWHSSIEILFVLQGKMTVIIEDQTWELKEDDIFLINPHHIHETHSQDCSLIVVQIRLAEFHLNWALPENIQFDCNSAAEKFSRQRYFKLKHLIVMLLKNTSTDSEFSQLSNYTCAIELLQELCIHFRQAAPAQAPHSIKYLNRLKSILDYINQNYMDNLTLTGIAQREFLTPTYLSAFFEKTMGTTLLAYITKIRLGHAVFDLVNTRSSIETISSRNGFASSRAFSSAFKKYYKMLPSEYRRQIEFQNFSAKNSTSSRQITAGTPETYGNEPPNLPVTAFPFLPAHQNSYLELEHYDFLNNLAPYIREYPDTDVSYGAGHDGCRSQIPSENNPIRQDCGQSFEAGIHIMHWELGEIPAYGTALESFNESFKCFCGISRASELLLPPIQKMLRRVQREIGFKYIKFHGILDDDLMVCQRNKEGQLIFCFTYIDMILDFLLENHLRPMIQFSFMPAALASQPKNTVFQKPVIISPPSDDAQWCQLITALTNHLLNRYGKKEVCTWIFTFWNETLNGLSFDFENAGIGLKLYQLTRQCVKACEKKLNFASTSYSALNFPEFNYDIFLNYARENHCLPDAYIFHFYPVVADNNAFSLSASQWKAQDFTKPVALSRDKNIFHKFLNGVAAHLPEASNAPVYITEWNFTPSHREWLNDTCFCACYIVRNLLQNFNKANGFCHWCLTDLHQELPMPDALFHGGMGLFTRNGIPKPSYFAYKFLNCLYKKIVFSKEGCFITTDGSGFAILLYNYCHFNNLYSHGISFDASHENWQRAFPDAQTAVVSFSLSGLEANTYRIKEQYVNPCSGSAFEAWLSMGRPDLNNPEEIQLLAAKSMPGFFQKEVTVQNNMIEYSASLLPHEIRLISISSSSDN